MTPLWYKIKEFHQQQGFSGLLLKICAILGHAIHTWYQKRIRKEHALSDYLLENRTPIASLKVSSASYRLNLVLDNLKEGSFYGGTGCSIILAALFCQRKKIPLRVISRNSESEAHLFFNFLAMQGIEKLPKVEFFSDYDRKMRLEISDRDMFLATSWQTLEAVETVNLRSRFFYLLLDPPPLYGDAYFCYRHALNNPRAIKIANFPGEIPYFEPAFLKKLYRGNVEVKSKNRFLFYVRPDKPQHLFRTGLKFLDEALLRGILAENEWEIYFAGEPVPRITFSNGMHPKNLGKLPWEKYLSFIQTVDLGLCLQEESMVSYPALDIVASGGVALTNSMTALDKSSNMIPLKVESPHYIDAFSKAAELACDKEQRRINFSRNRLIDDWNAALDSILNYMEMHQ